MSTITQEQQAAIVAVLARMDNLPSGTGTAENACSIAAINLALTGKITDEIPNCMSEVMGKWIIRIQDAMPAGIRNSVRWRSLLPPAAGTGRDAEKKLADCAMDWMWCDVLPKLQPVADKGGFGAKWLAMTTQKTANAANATYAAAAHAATANANASYAYAYAYASYAATNAATYAATTNATYASYAATNAASYAANANASYAASYAANANATNAASYAAAYAATAYAAANDFWESIDPCGCLERMINITKKDLP